MGMNADYRPALAEYILREANPYDKYGHQARLYALTQLVGRGHRYDDDIVYAAVWLHDLGVFIGHRPEDLDALIEWDSVRYAIEKSPAILNEFSFPAEKIPAVVDAIRTHQPHAQPSTIEGTIIRDADILEQLGAVSILRTVAKVGRDTRFPSFTAATASLRRSLSELPAQLKLETARHLAVPKITTLEIFLQAVEAESYNSLF
jgi:uncharacterized protein